MRILVIPSSDYLGHPYPMRHHHIFERLTRFGAEVFVLRFKLYEKIRRSTACKVREIPHEIRVTKQSVYYVVNSLQHIHSIIRLVKREGIDLIILCNILPAFGAYLIKRLSGLVKVVVDLKDHYPSSAAGYMVSNLKSVPGSLVISSIETLFSIVMRSSDAVICASEALCDFAKRYGAKNVYYIPNGIGEHFLNLYDKKSSRSRLNINEESFVTGYLGGLEFWLDMSAPLKGFKEYLERYNKNNTIFLIIGGKLQTSYSLFVDRLIENLGIKKNVIRMPFVDYQDVPKIMSAMDIGLIPFDVHNPTAYYACPNKLWEYSSQEVAVVSTPIPEVLKHRDYVTVIKGSPQDYFEVFHLFNKRRDLLVEKAKKARERSKEFTWTKISEKYYELLRETIES